MADALFPPRREDSARWLRRFVAAERSKRIGMLQKHPGDRDYWLGRVAECDAALGHISNLEADE